jgi:hypothetical protein
MIMGDVFGDGVMQGRFAEEDHPVEAFILDRFDESFGKGVEVPALARSTPRTN